MFEPPSTGTSTARVAVGLAPPASVVGQVAAKVVLAAAAGPTTPAIRSPPLLGPSVVSEPIRSVPVADLPLLAAVPHGRRRLVAYTRRLRLLPAPPNGPTRAVVAAVVPRPNEAAASRSPLIPPAAPAPRPPTGVIIARVPAPRTYAGPIPAVPCVAKPEAGSTAVEAAERRPVEATAEAPSALVPTGLRPTAADPASVATKGPVRQVLVRTVTRQIPVLPGGRRRPAAPRAFLARKRRRPLALVGRHVMPTAAAGRRGPSLRLSVAQGRGLVAKRARVGTWQGQPRKAAPVEPKAVAAPVGPTTEVGIRPAASRPIPRQPAVPWRVPAVGPAPTTVPAKRRPSTRLPARLPARRRSAVGRLRTIALVPTGLLLLVARVVVVGLVRKAREVVPSPVSRKALLSPHGPARAQASAVVQRPIEA